MPNGTHNRQLLAPRSVIDDTRARRVR